MKVENINYPVLTNQHRLKSVPDKGSMSLRGELCKNNNGNVNRGYYSGSSVSFGSAANSSLRWLNRINKFTKEHNTITQSLVALVLAGVFRPLAIVSLPGKKNKEDKIYASSHSIASGLIGFIVSSIIVAPLDSAAKLVTEEATDIKDRLSEALERRAKGENMFLTKEELLKGKKFLSEKFIDIYGEFKDGKLLKINRKALDRTATILNMTPDTLFLGVLKAMLTIALIPPILKYVFGIEKSKSANSQSAEVQNNKLNQEIAKMKETVNKVEAVKSEFAGFPKPAIAKFLGGER